MTMRTRLVGRQECELESSARYIWLTGLKQHTLYLTHLSGASDEEHDQQSQ